MPAEKVIGLSWVVHGVPLDLPLYARNSCIYTLANRQAILLVHGMKFVYCMATIVTSTATHHWAHILANQNSIANECEARRM